MKNDTCIPATKIYLNLYIGSLLQERHNSISDALELRFSCTKSKGCLAQYNYIIWKENQMKMVG